MRGIRLTRRWKALPLIVAALPMVASTGAARAVAQAAPVDPVAFAAVWDDIAYSAQGHPLGVPPSYSFYNGGEVDYPLPPPGWSAATSWGVVFEASEGSPATNTRVEVRNEQLHLWSKSRHQWVVYQAQVAPWGLDYYNPDGPLANQSFPAGLRGEPDGGVSVKLPHGAWFHFWPNRVSIPGSDVGGLFTTFEARLVKDNPDGPDDTASARYVAAAGADWWANKSAGWPANRQVLYGRFVYVSAAWRSYNGSTWSPAQITQAPPNLHVMG